ncbi:CZB domain-containing protein [Hydrogenimonas cancrithermarum]|nr:CZB domain-containing protein [Hydrogenimonas cancrithermarum]
MADLSAKQAKYIHNSLFGTLAKVDHIIFKSLAYTTVLNEDAEKAQLFSDHRHCRFGEWYYEGKGKELFGHTKAFKAIETPHATVHEMVLKTIPCAETKTCLTPARRPMVVENFSKMEEASNRLFSLIREMVEEANPDAKLETVR